MNLIGGAVLSLYLVSEPVVAKKPHAEVLPFLLRSKTDDCCEIAPNELVLDEGMNTIDIFKKSLHNEALAHLCDFADASELTSLVLPGLFGNGSLDLPIESAIVVMRATAAIYDLVQLAAFVHKHLVLLASRGVLISGSSLFGQLTWAALHLPQMMSELDNILTSAAATQAESGAWDLVPSIATMKEWRKTFCIFLRAALDSAVSSFVAALSIATTKCRDTTPAWEACIVGESFDLEMSKKLVGSGRLNSIVDSYNAVHNVLSSMNKSAQLLHITPRLQDHLAGREPIAIAFATMSSSMTAAICSMGLEILDITGPSASRKAADFVAQYRSHASSKALPSAFWAEFEALASLSSSGRGRASQATPASAPLVPISAGPSAVASGESRGDAAGESADRARKAGSDNGSGAGQEAASSRRGLKRIRK